MMVLSQGAMTLGAVVWGLSAEIAGTRFTLLAAAFLFCLTAAVLMLRFRIPTLLATRIHELDRRERASLESLSRLVPLKRKCNRQINARVRETHHGLLQ